MSQQDTDESRLSELLTIIGELYFEETVINSKANIHLIESHTMSEIKLTKTDLTPIVERHKMLSSTLIRMTDQSKLNQTNFEQWKLEFEIQMRNLMLAKLLHNDWTDDVIATTDFIDLDQKAQDNILFNIADYLKRFVQSATSAKRMYARLIEHFEGSVIIRGWRLCKQLKSVLMDRNESLDQITFNYQNIVDQFNKLFPTVPDEFYISLYCAIIPDQYDYLLSDVLNKPDVKYDEIVKQTMAAFVRRKEKDNVETPKVYSNCNIQANETKQTSNQQERKNPRRKTNGSKKPNDRYCDFCKKPGHPTNKCWLYLKDILDGKVDLNQISKDKQVETTADKEKEKTSNEKKFNVGAIMLSSLNDDDLDPNKYYLDTGAANHVFNSTAGSIEMINQLSLVRSWDNSQTAINGIGVFKLKTETDCELTLNNVLVKATGAANFISYSKLDKTRLFRIEGEDGQLKVIVKNTNDILMVGNLMENGLYELDLKPIVDVRINAIQISNTVPAEIALRYWHKILAHRGFDKLISIKHALGIKGKLKKRLICDTCTMTKATKIKFDRSLSIADEPFDLVHTDLSGIVRIANPDGFNYFLIFVDDNTRYIFVFLLSRKFQVVSCYKQFVNWIKVQFNKSIKNLRSDNGTEFVNKLMKSEVTEAGTNHHLTCHGNPQQNARSERPMRTIEEAARALMLEANIHIKFWPYAILFAVFILNALPHDGIDGEIPYYRLFKRLPRYKQILKFGINVYSLIQDPLGKFGNRARPAIFLGYPQYVKGYYVYLINEGKIDISRDVYVSEQEANHNVTVERENSTPDEHLMNEFQRKYMMNTLYSEENESTADDLLEQQEFDVEEDTFHSCQSSLDYNDYNNLVNLSNSNSNNQSDQNQDFSNEIQDLNESVDQPVSSTDEHQLETTQQLNETSQTEASTNQSSNKPIFLKSICDLKSNTSTCPVGDVIMNKTEHALFTERFPNAQIRRIAPYAGGPKNQVLNIWRLGAITVPRSYRQATTGENNSIWKEAMNREYAAQIANGTWKLVERPPNAKIFPMIWLYKHQFDSQGMLIGGKARLVALGNKQVIELNENNYAPVVNFVSIRLLFSIAVKYGFHIHHLDCNTAFLNADVEGEFYTYQPEGFKIKGKEHMVCKLVRALYGLRQSARRWYLKLRSILIKLGFRQLFTDSCIYILETEDSIIIIAVYVDDLLAIGNHEEKLISFKSNFGKIVKVKDYDQVTRFLGLDIKYDRLNRTMEMSQIEYIERILKEANFEDCKPMKVPMTENDAKLLKEKHESDAGPVDIEWYQQTLGKIIYLSNLYRFDMAFTVSALCSRMHNPDSFHAKLLKNLLRYLKHSKNKKLIYENGNKGVEVYADSNFEANISKLGILAFVNGNLVSWTSKKQQRVVTSTCESEILSILDSVNEVEYLKCLIDELGFGHLVEDAVTIFNDNLSAKHTLETGGDFSKNRHYRNRVNRIIRAIDDRLVKVSYVNTNSMLADMMTKAFGSEKLSTHLVKIGFK